MSFSSKKEALTSTGLSASSLKRLRLSGSLQEGIHWVRFGPRKVLWNLPLVLDFLANQASPELHQKAIAAYLGSLPSSQAVKATKNKKSA